MALSLVPTGVKGPIAPIKIKDATRLYSRAVKPGAFVRKLEKRSFTTALTRMTVGDIGNSFALAKAAYGHQSKKYVLMMCDGAHIKAILKIKCNISS
jgi:hypothetical protein